MVPSGMSCTVYSITHRASGREYIGITSGCARKRWARHLWDGRRGRGTRIARALRKYGKDAFDFKVEAEVSTFDEAKIAEKRAIAARRPAFNLTAGGDGTVGYVPGAETRAKISAANGGPSARKSDAAKARCKTSEGRENLSRARTVPRTAATVDAIRERGRRRGMPPGALAAAVAANKGRKRTAEQCARIAASLRGKPLSVKVRKARMGRRASPETRAKMTAAQRARNVGAPTLACTLAAVAANRMRTRSAEEVARRSAALREAWARRKVGDK